jgi:hypothetical protein
MVYYFTSLEPITEVEFRERCSAQRLLPTYQEESENMKRLLNASMIAAAMLVTASLTPAHAWTRHSTAQAPASGGYLGYGAYGASRPDWANDYNYAASVPTYGAYGAYGYPAYAYGSGSYPGYGAYGAYAANGGYGAYGYGGGYNRRRITSNPSATGFGQEPGNMLIQDRDMRRSD